jgi:type IV secretion system protein VirB11
VSFEQQEETARRLQAKFRDHMGKELLAILDEPLVSDVCLNPDGRVFVERIGGEFEELPFRVSASRRAALIKTAVALGGEGSHRDGASILETRIPEVGWRFEGILPPTVPAPAISIRKPAERVLTLRSYVDRDEMSAEAFAALQGAIASDKGRNILIVGGTGSGKTTLANALLHELAARCPSKRVVTIEDTLELKVSSANNTQLLVTFGVTGFDLLAAALRMRPDRIVVGEVRGPEVKVLLQAWNSGHSGGLCTVHADGAEEGLLRLEQLYAQGGGDRLTARAEIAKAVHVVVYIERRAGRRSVGGVLEVSGLTPDGGYVWKRVA